MQDQIIVSLNNPVNLKISGEEQYFNELVINAPTSKHLKHYMPIKTAFLKALQLNSGNVTQDDQKDEKDESNQDDITGEQVYMLLMMSDCDIAALIESFKKILLTPQTSSLNGVQELVEPFYNKLSLSDIERSFGEYIKVFILGSLMQKS